MRTPEEARPNGRTFDDVKATLQARLKEIGKNSNWMSALATSVAAEIVSADPKVADRILAHAQDLITRQYNLRLEGTVASQMLAQFDRAVLTEVLKSRAKDTPN